MTDELKPCPEALKFPRHPNSVDGWTIDPIFLTQVQRKIDSVGGYVVLEDVERALLAAEQTYTRVESAEVERLRDENKRLRALAEFGAKALWSMEKYPDDPIVILIEGWAELFGLYKRTEPDENGDTEIIKTDLAQLPEESKD